MSRSLILIRHAETVANADRRWQGSLDSPLSDTGTDQLTRLRRRFGGTAPARLIASDKQRTLATAEAIGAPTPDPRWREFDVGAWEGLTTEEVQERYPGEMEALIAGEDVSLGGGEQMSDFHARIAEAFDDAFDDMDDGDETVVVTHGGVIWSVMNRVLGREGTGVPAIPAHNTSITRVRALADGSLQLSVFNDATHLTHVPVQFGPDGTVVTLIRHGRTIGNMTDRWQGRSDSPLTDEGRATAAAAARHAASFDALYTSPLGRAAETADILAAANGHPEPLTHEGIIEMSFGMWEDLTSEEARAQDPELFDTIYRQERDEPRGRTGESFTQAGERMRGAIAELAASQHRNIGAVSHGAAIRSYTISVLGLGFEQRNRIPLPRNTSMSRIVYTDRPILASYNVAPHLD